MAGLVPAIHVFAASKKDVDARIRGHDAEYCIHAGFMPANFTTLPHFSICSATNLR